MVLTGVHMQTSYEKKIKQAIYPVYLAHEIYGTRPVIPESSFTVGGSWASAPHRNNFIVYSLGDKAVFEIMCENFRLGLEEVYLYFDPAHSSRKPNNYIRFRLGGEANYERFTYQYEKLSFPEGADYSFSMKEGRFQAKLSVPFDTIGIRSNQHHFLGFNVIRTECDDEHKPYVKWSGLPCDTALLGQGAGDLIFTRGLDENELEKLISLACEESNNYYTAWYKRTYPVELDRFVKIKSRGFTGRIREADSVRARSNAEKTEWGRQTKSHILNVADYWSSKSDNELFSYLPSANPRALTVSQHFGDPISGGNRATLYTCLERPYQFYNPETGVWWYLGMTISNPSTGEDVLVADDGNGFLTPAGFPVPKNRYMFIAAYRMFLFSMILGTPYSPVLEDKNICPETTGKTYAGALSNLAYAYTLTGDKKYAYKAWLLAVRIAELFPFMNGGHGDGSFSDSMYIAECSTTETQWLFNYFEAIDLLFDSLPEVETELSYFFSSKPSVDGYSQRSSFNALQLVQEMIPHVLYSCEIERLRGADWSLRALNLEILLASFMESGELMKRVLFEGHASLSGKCRNLFYRDGRYAYDSPHYVQIMCIQMMMTANVNYGFCDGKIFSQPIDMFEDVHFPLKRIIELYFHLKSGSLTAAFGDGPMDNKEPLSDSRRRGEFPYNPAFEITFARMASARQLIGQFLKLYDREQLAALRIEVVKQTYHNHTLLLLSSASNWDDYQAIEQNAYVVQHSHLLQDSEISILRAGTDFHNCKHVMLYGAPSATHAHGDKLGLWIGAFGYHLLAGAGSYPFSWISPKLHDWENHSAACTVVIVDGKKQQFSYSKQLAHHEGVVICGAGLSNDLAYPGTYYERWSWLIQTPNGIDAYLIDTCHLEGGKYFDYNTCGFHMNLQDVHFEGIDPSCWGIMEGTLAGVDAELYSQPGYGYMRAVRKAVVQDSVSWSFPYQNAGLRVHALPNDKSTREIICCLGEKGGQELRKAEWSPFVMLRDSRTKKSNSVSNSQSHKTSFCTLLEPYQNNTFVRKITPMQLLNRESPSRFDPTGVEVQLEDGHIDIIMGTYNQTETVTYQDSMGRIFTTDAKFSLLRYNSDKLIHAEAIRFTRLSDGVFERLEPVCTITGVIANVSLDDCTILVELNQCVEDIGMANRVDGTVALIDSPDYVKPSAYYIRDPNICGGGRYLTFRSDISLVKQDVKSPYQEKKLELGTKSARFYKGDDVYLDIKQGDTFKLDVTYAASFV